MDLDVSAIDNALHLALFLAGGAGLGVLGVALVERIGDAPVKVVRIRYVVAAVALFAGLFVAERLYHALSSL